MSELPAPCPEVLCNWCGLPCNLEPVPWDQPQGLVQVAVVGGYPSTPGNGSGAFDDMTGYRFSLCEFCLDHLFSQFKVPVELFDPRVPFMPKPGETVEQAMERTGGFVSLGSPETFDPWVPAATRVERDDWRAHKKEFYEAKARRDAARGK